MSVSVARRVAVGNTAVLVTALLAVGIATGALIHRQRVRALDEALLAAVHGRAHPEWAGEVEVEHSRSPVDSWLVGRGPHSVPGEAVRNALQREGPSFLEYGDYRYVLLPFEVEYRDDERHEVAVAAAPRITIARSVGRFALIYSVVAALAAVLASLAQLLVVRRAFEPLERARGEADRVAAFGEGARLTEDGPREIRALLLAINGLLDRLDASYRAQSRFTAEAAHELRTPVTSMLGELDVALRKERPAAEMRAVLESVREDVDRLRRVVDALTAMARLDAGQAERGRELVRAAELADEALAAERKQLDSSGSAVRLELTSDCELEVNRSLIEVALGNLLRNAARHAGGTQVVLRVTCERGLAIFDVDDAGPGVPAEQRGELFARFVRSGEARRSDKMGLGLGLPIAREIARRHAGDCILTDSPLGGLRARLTVPSRPSEPPKV